MADLVNIADVVDTANALEIVTIAGAIEATAQSQDPLLPDGAHRSDGQPAAKETRSRLLCGRERKMPLNGEVYAERLGTRESASPDWTEQAHAQTWTRGIKPRWQRGAW